MLQLLLDEHVSPEVAKGLGRQHKSLIVHPLAEWEGGRFLGQADEAILAAAVVQKLTLVTYDRRTLPPLLKAWVEAGRSHGGVVFVDEKTIAPSDIGGLVRSLETLSRQAKGWDWTNRICFLRH